MPPYYITTHLFLAYTNHYNLFFIILFFSHLIPYNFVSNYLSRKNCESDCSQLVILCAFISMYLIGSYFFHKYLLKCKNFKRNKGYTKYTQIKKYLVTCTMDSTTTWICMEDPNWFVLPTISILCVLIDPIHFI